MTFEMQLLALLCEQAGVPRDLMRRVWEKALTDPDVDESARPWLREQVTHAP